MEASPKNGAKSDPICQWQHEQDCDVFMVHVPEYKKEHLKVQVNSCGVLRIFGNQPAGSSFNKEVSVPLNCNTDEIQANYVDGVLHIIMPKKISDPSQDNNKPNPSKAQESSNENDTKIAFNIAAIVAVLSVISAFSYYMYKSLKGE